MANRLDRIALVVDDLDAVAADLQALLGIRFVVRDIVPLGIRVGIGEDGIELVEKASPDCDVERFWRGPLAALVVKVDDIEATTEKMLAAGYTLDHELRTPGLEERHFGNSFHDLPLVLYSSPVGLLEAAGDPSGPEVRRAQQPRADEAVVRR